MGWKVSCDPPESANCLLDVPAWKNAQESIGSSVTSATTSSRAPLCCFITVTQQESIKTDYDRFLCVTA